MKRVLAAGKNDQPVTGIRAGTFAIWDAGEDGADYAPAISPRDHLDRIAFHSDFDYIGIERTLTGSINLAAGSYSSDNPLSSISLGEHGQDGLPMMIAQASSDGEFWVTVNGTTFTQIQSALRGRSFVIQADDTHVYAAVNSVGTLTAETIYFRVHILMRNFGQSRPETNEIFHADAAVVRAAGGVFDTSRRYLQSPSPGQDADIRHHSGQTLKIAAGDESGELDLGFGSHGNHFNLPLATTWATSWPPYIVTPAPADLVMAGSGEISSVAHFSPSAFRLSNADGDDVFDSARKIVSFVDEFTASVSVPSRSAVASDGPHEVIHYSAAVPDGASIIMGWMKLTSSSMRIANGQSTDFSGGIIVFGWFFPYLSQVYVRALSIIFPRIKDGYIEVVEHYYNRQMSGSDNAAIPSYSFDVHLFACALTGGI